MCRDELHSGTYSVKRKGGPWKQCVGQFCFIYDNYSVSSEWNHDHEDGGKLIQFEGCNVLCGGFHPGYYTLCGIDLVFYLLGERNYYVKNKALCANQPSCDDSHTVPHLSG